MAGSDGPGHTVLTEKEWVSRMIECELGVSLNSQLWFLVPGLHLPHDKDGIILPNRMAVKVGKNTDVPDLQHRCSNK